MTFQAIINFFKFLWCTAITRWRGKAVLASVIIQRRRLTVCGVCSKREGWQCAICGCFIQLKTAFANERCPDNPPKWIQEEPEESNNS